MGKPKFYYHLALSLGSPLLLWMAWPPFPFTWLVFVGFVPWLFLEEQFTKNPNRNFREFIGWIYLGLLAWNALTTYWVTFATVGGGLMALFANAILMTIPFGFYHWARKNLKWDSGPALMLLSGLWFSLELLHLNWQLAWPWLNLGNVFAEKANWVQWYEYTGTFGGTLWIWLANIIGFYLLRAFHISSSNSNRQRVGILGALFVLIISIPIFWSYSIDIDEKVDYHIEAVLIQPNLDPYSEKFDEDKYDKQLKHFFRLSAQKTDSTTDLLVWPETSIPGNFHQAYFSRAERIKKIKDHLRQYQDVKLMCGVNTYLIYDEKATPTARKKGRSDQYYDMFNAAALIDTNDQTQFYHKSKLVPGVEKMPYPGVLGFLQELAINMGGTSGSLGSQKEASLFKINDSFKIAPVICYESVFGSYVGDFVRKGADVITVITNDGWWGKTAGYKQHFKYAVLRAIEMRRSIARSANTGISGFITAEGKMHHKTKYWVADVIKMKVPVRKGQTFYAVYGDYLGYFGTMVAGILVLAMVGQGIRAWWKKG